jgi:tRNA pseudouridine38-40 synthase
MDLVKFKLTIAFDGTRYQGWQVKKIGTGVQEIVEQAVAKLFPSVKRIRSSSRTDTGVHALGMVAELAVPKSECRMPARKLPLALNAWLPEDIRVLSAQRVRASFHARFDASGKQYRYFVWNHPAMNPLLRAQAWHVRRPLNVAVMRRAVRGVIGRHDFRSFRANPNDDTDSTVRHLTRLDLRRSGPLLTFIIEGDGFLYKMCRGIVGTLVQVGEGKITAEEIPAILAGRDRRSAGVTAPAHGLVLWKVFYRKKAKNAVHRTLPA